MATTVRETNPFIKSYSLSIQNNSEKWSHTDQAYSKKISQRYILSPIIKVTNPSIKAKNASIFSFFFEIFFAICHHII